MGFHLIDVNTWSRKEYYEHYLNQVVCTYALTVNLDVTNLEGTHLYPAMLWLLTDTVNEMPQFRTALSNEGVGVYDSMHPSYTIFNKDNENFSVIWTAFHPDYRVFLKAYEDDTAQYASSTRFSPKADKPGNTFDVSMLPWTTFTAFNINLFGSGRHLLPIFTLGKKHKEQGQTLLPLAIQVHHAVCDGFHVSKFIRKLQNKITQFAG